MRDVVAHRPVTARRGIAQPPMFIEKRNCDTIHFRLDYDRDFLVRQETRDARVKVGDLIFGVSIVETEHRYTMRDLRESFERFAAHPLRR